MPRWTVTIDGNDHVEVEAPNVEEAGVRGVKEWRKTVSGRQERREIRVLVVVLNERVEIPRPPTHSALPPDEPPQAGVPTMNLLDR